MRKKFRLIFNIIVCLIIFSPVLGASEVDNGGINFELSTERNSVVEGDQIAFVFKYNSTDNLEQLQAASGQQITVDFSQLVESGADIEYKINSDVFTTTISDNGVVTLTINDLSTVSESVTSLSGIGYFYVRAKDTEHTLFVPVNTSFDSNLEVEILRDDEYIENTGISTDVGFAEPGDIVTYQLLVNGCENDVYTLDINALLPEEMTFVPGSLTVSEVDTWDDVTRYFNVFVDPYGGARIKTEQPFRTQLVVTFQAEVQSLASNYKTRARVTYNGHTVDGLFSEIDLQVDAHNEMAYNHGNIEIENVDENGNPIANSEFKIVNQDGIVVDQLVTNQDGLATSKNLAFGEYTVEQTSVADGYVTDRAIKRVAIPFTTSNSVTRVNFESKSTLVVEEFGTITVENVTNGGDPVVGATIQIIDNSGAVVEQLTTDSQGKAVSSELPLGTYSVVETAVPSGYEIARGSQTASLTTKSPTTTVELVSNVMAVSDNNFIEVHATNSDGDDLAGISFGIYDENGNLVDVVVTDENGNAQSDVLEDGSYYVMKLDEDNNPSGDQYWVDLGKNTPQVEYVIDTSTKQQPAEDDTNSGLAEDVTVSDTDTTDSQVTTASTDNDDFDASETANYSTNSDLTESTESDQVSGTMTKTGSNFGLMIVIAIIALIGLITLKIKSKKEE